MRRFLSSSASGASLRITHRSRQPLRLSVFTTPLRFAAGEIRSMPLLTTTGEHARILKYSQERKLVTVFQPKRVYGTTIIAHIYPCIYTCANCCTQMSKRPSLQGRAVTLTARKRFSVVSFFLIQIQGTENQSFAKRKRQMSVSLFVSG